MALYLITLIAARFLQVHLYACFTCSSVHLYQLFTTRVKLAVTSPSRHFCDLAKKTPKQKRTDKLKFNSRKTYYGKIISQTTQTNCFKRLV